MTPDQFAYWLQGFAEINQTPPTEAQWKCIKEHLGTVFKKITPSYAPNPVDVFKYNKPCDSFKWPGIPEITF